MSKATSPYIVTDQPKTHAKEVPGYFIGRDGRVVLLGPDEHHVQVAWHEPERLGLTLADRQRAEDEAERILRETGQYVPAAFLFIFTRFATARKWQNLIGPGAVSWLLRVPDLAAHRSGLTRWASNLLRERPQEADVLTEVCRIDPGCNHIVRATWPLHRVAEGSLDDLESWTYDPWACEKTHVQST